MKPNPQTTTIFYNILVCSTEVCFCVLNFLRLVTAVTFVTYFGSSLFSEFGSNFWGVLLLWKLKNEFLLKFMHQCSVKLVNFLFCVPKSWYLMKCCPLNTLYLQFHQHHILSVSFLQIGEDSAKCRKCGGKMSAYFCPICKHFTSIDKNPYHCEKCGICR